MDKMKMRIVIILALIASISCTGFLYYKMSKPKSVEEQFEIIEKETTATMYEKPGLNKTLKDWKEVNPDIKYLLTINDKEFPVAYHKEKDFYLRKDVYGNKDRLGTVFLDHRTKPGTKNQIIYGHSSFSKDLVFTFFRDYLTDDDFYKDHSSFTLENEDSIDEYRVIAVSKLSAAEPTWTDWNVPNTDETFNVVDFGSNILKNADKIFCTKLKINEPFIVLMTCDMDTYNTETYDTLNRIILFSQRVSSEIKEG